MTGCGCAAVIDSGDFREYLWRKIRGSRQWPVFDPIGVQDGLGHRFLRGHVEDLDNPQKLVVAAWLAGRFNSSIEVVARTIGELGYVPIRDKNVAVAICDTHCRWLIRQAVVDPPSFRERALDLVGVA